MRFVLHELPSAPLVRQIKDGAIDAGFVHPFPPDETLQFVTVLREPFIVGLPESHPLAGESTVDLSDCADDTFVLVSRSGSPGFFNQCLALCQGYGFSPAVIEEGNSPAARYGMVSAGIGVTVVAESAVHAPFPGVVFRPLTDPSVDVELAFAYRPNDDSAALAALMQTLQEVAGPLEIPPTEPTDDESPDMEIGSAADGLSPERDDGNSGRLRRNLDRRLRRVEDSDAVLRLGQESQFVRPPRRSHQRLHRQTPSALAPGPGRRP